MCTIGPVVLNLVEVVMAHMEYAYSFGGLSTGIYNKKHVPWTSGPVWTGAENLALTGIRSLDRPACSESLY